MEHLRPLGTPPSQNVGFALSAALNGRHDDLAICTKNLGSGPTDNSA